MSDRFFITPAQFEVFRDTFQNIARRLTYGAGVGYEVIDKPKLEWTVNTGPGYLETTFDTVTEGEDDTEGTPVLTIGTEWESDPTRWLEFNGSYRGQFVNEESGSYIHRFEMSLETDVTKRTDFRRHLDLGTNPGSDRGRERRRARDRRLPHDRRLHLRDLSRPGSHSPRRPGCLPATRILRFLHIFLIPF